MYYVFRCTFTITISMYVYYSEKAAMFQSAQHFIVHKILQIRQFTSKPTMYRSVIDLLVENLATHCCISQITHKTTMEINVN